MRVGVIVLLHGYPNAVEVGLGLCGGWNQVLVPALIHYEHTLPTAADGMELSLALSWAPGKPIFLEVFPASFLVLH